MIQPEDIQRKANAIYQDFLRAWLRGGDTSFFPRLVPANREPESDLGKAVQSMRRLRDCSKEVAGFGYSIDWQEVNSRRFGRNLFPSRIFFENKEDLLRYVGKMKEFALLESAVALIRSSLPALDGWVQENVSTVISALPNISRLVGVVTCLRDRPRPGCFTRELPVSVHTKFVEEYEGVLRQWLDIVLPPTAIRADEEHFARRYGLRYAEPHMLIRFLDPNVQQELGFPCEEVSVPLHTFGSWKPGGVSVIVVENKVSLLTLPSMPRTIALGALGNSIGLLRYVPWLSGFKVTYWGDLDVEGLEILSRLRAEFANARSVMMDFQTLENCRSLTTPGTGRKPKTPRNLTEREVRAFEECALFNLRLEQERIPPEVITSNLCGSSSP